ncbi:radical SAM protein [Paracoccus limosus]|uniref:radical SAM protein n=1 Tax=Paracoccus limosus TaxID=913252 RepID=UPI00147812C7|nr:radical SAM protein [Paracoccus limosus]
MAVVKIASRCNLNCNYCYMYNLGDRTALAQPKVMPDAIIDATVDRSMEHAAERGLKQFRFVFHGGEPLMAGAGKFRRLIEAARRRGEEFGVTPDFSIQTNGVLLTEEWCSRLAEWRVRVGVSLDGPKAVNDRRRVTHAGRGSYDDVIAGWERAKASGLRPGILTVIDPTSAPVEAYSHLCALGPGSVDFLLSDANYERRPPGDPVDTLQADWLLEIFRLWRAEPAPPFRVRMFEQIIATTLGLTYRNDAMGEGENEIVVIETDGEVGPVDTLRAALPGASRTGFNVLRNALADALDHPLLRQYHGANDALCATCRACPINRICGGGYLSHRYSAERDFDNPSVYCNDLTKLVTTVRRAALEILPEEALRQGELAHWSTAEVIAARGAALAGATIARAQ